MNRRHRSRSENPLTGEGLLIGAAIGAGLAGLWAWWQVSQAQSSSNPLSTLNPSELGLTQQDLTG